MNNEIFNELVACLDLNKMYELKGYEGRYLVNVKRGKIFDMKRFRYLKNKINANGYIYHRLVNPVTKEAEVISMHVIVLRAALGVDYNIWKKWNLVIDHRSGDRGDCGFENLQLLTQSENNKKRAKFKRRKNFTDDELKKMYIEFEKLEDVKHFDKMKAYVEISKLFDCSSHTIHIKYLDFKRTQTI